MLNRKKIKTNLKKNFILGFAALILLLAFIFLTRENFKAANKREYKDTELQMLEQRITELTEESWSFQSQIERTNEQEYLEKVAREELNLKRQGENVVAFPVMEENVQTEPQGEEQQNLWQKIMNKIR